MPTSTDGGGGRGTGGFGVATDRLVEFWRALGARVQLRPPDAHDVEVAWVSHLPHVLAFAYEA